MKNNIAAAELLSLTPSAFQVMHTAAGMDFEKPYGIIQGNGRFTVNQVTKAATAEGYTPTAKAYIFVRVVDEYNTYKKNPHTAIFTPDGIRLIDRMPCIYKNGKWHAHSDNFYAKSDFEEWRKNEGAEWWLVWQQPEHLQPVRGSSGPLDTSRRYKLNPAPYTHTRGGDGKGNSWIRRLSLILTGEQGNKTEVTTFNRPTELTDIIDKSGYLLQERREDWKRKAEALRKERAKAEFLTTDNSDKVKDLKEKIAARKNELIAQLQTAATYEEIKQVEEALSYWNGFGDIVHKFETFARMVKEKSFPSVAHCEEAYNLILQKLKKNAA